MERHRLEYSYSKPLTRSAQNNKHIYKMKLLPNIRLVNALLNFNKSLCILQKKHRNIETMYLNVNGMKVKFTVCLK